MCLTIFVGADCPLSLLPFDKMAPAFFAETLWMEAEAAAQHITKPFLVTVGSLKGCGCGFAYSDDDLVLDADETIPEHFRASWRTDYNETVSSVQQLSQYIRLGLTAGTVTVYCCWYGDWEAKPIGMRRVTPEYFGGNAFSFVERELLVVSD